MRDWLLDGHLANLLMLCLPFGLVIFAISLALSIAAHFSAKCLEQLRGLRTRNRRLAALGFLLICLGMLANDLPPEWAERRLQRVFTLRTVERHGGWSAFEAEAEVLLRALPASGKQLWIPGHFGDRLPESCPLMRALKPTIIRIDDSSETPQYLAVQVFGMHRTGGHDSPGYILYYHRLRGPKSQLPADLSRGWVPRPFTDAVFEIGYP